MKRTIYIIGGSIALLGVLAFFDYTLHNAYSFDLLLLGLGLFLIGFNVILPSQK